MVTMTAAVMHICPPPTPLYLHNPPPPPVQHTCMIYTPWAAGGNAWGHPVEGRMHSARFLAQIFSIPQLLFY